MMRKLLIAGLCLSILFSCQAGDDKSAQAAKEKPLVVAMDLSFPPFEGIDAEGKPYGISVDMAKDLAASLGRDVEIVNVKWDGLIPGLRSGQYDAVISSMSVTPERQAVVDFSDPYGEMGIDFLARKDFVFTEPSVLNTPDVRIAVRKGTIGETLAMDQFPKARIVSLNDFESAVLEVLQNKADVALADPLTVYEYQKKYSEQLAAYYRSMSVVPLAIAVKKTDDKEFLNKVNEFVKKYVTEGKLKAVTDKYLSDVKEEFAKQNQPFFIY